MGKNRNITKFEPGFSLVEILAAMTIGSMVLVAVFTVYRRVEHTAAALTRSLDNSSRGNEVLQLMAEDLDKMVTTDSDTDVVLVNRHVDSHSAALFAIRTHYKDPTNKEQMYKEIIWQCNRNQESDANDLVMYRSCESIVPEDKLLDKNKDSLERSVYVPICRGVTYFNIDIITGEKRPDTIWPGGMTLGAKFTVSFAKPYKNADGFYEVPENEKFTRTIAFDKTRKIRFEMPENDPNAGSGNMMQLNNLGDTGSATKK